MLRMVANCCLQKNQKKNRTKQKICVFVAIFRNDETKHRRGFGSLLRRHTSFGAPDSNHSSKSTVTSSHENL